MHAAAARESASASQREPGPLELVCRLVPADWIDYNGHVHESRYLQLAADATDALLARLGVDADYLRSAGSYYTVETHLCHLGQLRAGEHVAVTTQVLGGDEKRLHVFHRVTAEGAAEPAATAEQMLLHVDAETGRAGPARGAVREQALTLVADHAALPRPARAGRGIEPSQRSTGVISG
jgi:carnitine 3-dehydrogenase